MPKRSKPKVLVVDDEPDILKLIPLRLRAEHLHVEAAENGNEALKYLSQSSFALVITDLMMPGMSGMELLERIQQEWPQTAVIILTAHGTIDAAVEAVKKGATDFIKKPVRSGELVVRVNGALRQWRLKQEVEELRNELQRVQRAEFVLIGKSAPMQKVMEQIHRIAASDVPVLIRGESGTGKELVARAIHRQSPRSLGRFVAVNCGALSENLLRDELFGHEKGAFTGAHSQKTGLFEEAEGGTLFLDEIGEISPAIQVQLLRVLQDQQFMRVGGTQVIQANVRILSATNRDLERAVQDGTFREDVFYRVNVIPLKMPPLRERTEDIPLLVDHFFNRYRTELNATEKKGFTREALDQMVRYEWPGNIRELENKVKRLLVLSEQEWIGVDSLMFDQSLPAQTTSLSYHESKSRFLEKHDVAFLKHVLQECGGNVSEASRLAGLDRKSLWRKMKQYSLDAHEFRDRSGG